MPRSSTTFFSTIIALVGCANAAPANIDGASIFASASYAASGDSSSTVQAPQSSPTVELASDNANNILWTIDSSITPVPMRGTLGSNILGPQNVPLDLQNADFLAPPSTDAGTV